MLIDHALTGCSVGLTAPSCQCGDDRKPSATLSPSILKDTLPSPYIHLSTIFPVPRPDHHGDCSISPPNPPSRTPMRHNPPTRPHRPHLTQPNKQTLPGNSQSKADPFRRAPPRPRMRRNHRRTTRQFLPLWHSRPRPTQSRMGSESLGVQ